MNIEDIEVKGQCGKYKFGYSKLKGQTWIVFDSEDLNIIDEVRNMSDAFKSARESYLLTN